jgi:hypothetical protein
MASLTEDMLHAAWTPSSNAMPRSPAAVLPADDEVDSIRDSIYSELLELMQINPSIVPFGDPLDVLWRATWNASPITPPTSPRTSSSWYVAWTSVITPPKKNSKDGADFTPLGRSWE